MRTPSLAQGLSHRKYPGTFHERSVSSVQERFMFSQVPHKTFEIIMDTLNQKSDYNFLTSSLVSYV